MELFYLRLKRIYSKSKNKFYSILIGIQTIAMLNKKTTVTEIFEDTTKVSKRAIILSLVVFVITVIILRLLIVSFEVSKFFIADITAIQFFTNALLSVITSIVAAFIFAYTFTVRENKKLHRLQNLSNKDYLTELLQAVDQYKGAYVEDYIATVKLCKHPSNQLITVKIRFEYKKYPVTNQIIITIYRLTNESDAKDLQFIVQERAVKEFVWQQDERTFPIPVDPKIEYSVKNLWVGKSKCTIDAIIKDNEITATGNIPGVVDISGLQSIEYQVKLPFETESILALTHDFPTLNATVNFDYSEVSDIIDVYVLTMAGLNDNPIPHDTNDPFLIRYKHRGWLSPQNGYVIAWWRKDVRQPLEPQPENEPRS
ncbi:MAG: hypothetical protein M3Q99_07125 [Acidobacteriota bacterium]|nr:hypothetical protein [Acidobacteriota bacterium]